MLKVGSAVAAVPDMTRVHVSKVDGHVTRVVSRVRRERVPMSELEGEEEAEFVELDLEKTLTWTGNAVTIQAGGEFRLPLIVPHPSVLAIQFEIDKIEALSDRGSDPSYNEAKLVGSRKAALEAQVKKLDALVVSKSCGQ